MYRPGVYLRGAAEHRRREQPESDVFALFTRASHGRERTKAVLNGSATGPFGCAVRRVLWLTCVAATAIVLAGPATANGSSQAAAAAAAPQNDAGGETPAPTADQSADDVPGVQIPVSLANGVFQRRLPFDVPFYVTGTPTGFANEMSLSVYRISSRAVLTDVVSALRSTVDCGAPDTATVRGVSRSTWRQSGTSQQFLLLVDALEPQRYYAFCFLSSGPVPFAEIEPAVRGMLVEAILSILGERPVGDLSLQLASNFHARLAEGITKLGAARPVRAVIPAGNLFSRETPIERDRPFIVLMTALVNPYQQMPNAREDYRAQRAVVAKALEAAKEPAKDFLTQAIIDALPAAATQLPEPLQAVRSTTPFDPAPFDVSEARVTLERVIAEARAKTNDAAANALQGLLDEVEGLPDIVSRYARQYERLREVSQQVLQRVELEAREVTVGLGSSVLTADMNRNAYVSLDLGMAYAWDLQNLVFYAGTNIYFRPINKNAPLGRNFWRRFALTIGITTSVKDESRRADDLRTSTGSDGTNSLLIGGGFRVTPSIRLGAGALVFKESETNPLVTQTSVAATPYVSMALDVNLGQIFRSMFPADQ
jgi:hypothetical protein